MEIKKISNINFKDNSISREYGAQNANLMLRDSNATVRFQQNQEFAENADSVTSNPIKAIGYKLYRTFSMIKDSTVPQQTENKRLNVIA